MNPPSSYEIILWKSLSMSVTPLWSDWATQMLMEGYDTEHLLELAAIDKPYNQFELKDLTDRVFKELKIDLTQVDFIFNNYASYVVNETINGRRNMKESLHDLGQLCIASGYSGSLQDFWSLNYAMQDLETSKHQWYWPNADRSNIDKVCSHYFEKWIKTHPLQPPF